MYMSGNSSKMPFLETPDSETALFWHKQKFRVVLHGICPAIRLQLYPFYFQYTPWCISNRFKFRRRGIRRRDENISIFPTFYLFHHFLTPSFLPIVWKSIKYNHRFSTFTFQRENTHQQKEKDVQSCMPLMVLHGSQRHLYCDSFSSLRLLNL